MHLLASIDPGSSEHCYQTSIKSNSSLTESRPLLQVGHRLLFSDDNTSSTKCHLKTLPYFCLTHSFATCESGYHSKPPGLDPVLAHYLSPKWRYLFQLAPMENHPISSPDQIPYHVDMMKPFTASVQPSRTLSYKVPTHRNWLKQPRARKPGMPTMAQPSLGWNTATFRAHESTILGTKDPVLASPSNPSVRHN